MTEKTITICGKEVKMIYCTATENGFEQISPNSINVFVPTFGKDEKGEDIIIEPAQAKIGDFVTLAVAGIIAYYSYKQKEMPITTDDVLYSSTPQERNDLISAIIELRNEWYAVPATVSETLNEDAANAKGDEPKN